MSKSQQNNKHSNKKKRKNKNKKLGLILLAEFLILIALVIGYGWYYINHTLDKMVSDTTDKKDIVVSEAVTDTMEDQYTTIVLYGLDTRDHVSMTQKGQAHSDAIMLVSINNETKEVKVVSVYRDTFLELATENPSNRKVTEAYFYGGPIGSIETLNKNLDLNIKDYVAVDFKALTKAIDALGGVTIHVKEKELNNLNHNIEEQIEVTGIYSEGVWSAGKQVLNGTQATAYSRIRKVGNNDFERTQRQRAVLTAMVEKAKQSDLGTINNLINEIFPLVATNMSNTQLLSMAASMFDYELGENTGFPLSHKTPTLGKKGSVVVPANLLSNVEYLHEFLYPDDTEYTPSEEVKRISDSITNETGVYDEFSDENSTEAPTSTNSSK